jgi:hypothetical protein
MSRMVTRAHGCLHGHVIKKPGLLAVPARRTASPKRLDRAAVEAALRLGFLADARNVVLVAAQGLGKR